MSTGIDGRIQNRNSLFKCARWSKNTALWNTKVRETKAVAVGEHLAEGCSLKGTARLVKVDASTVRRLNQRLGEHGQLFHSERVQAVRVEVVTPRFSYPPRQGRSIERVIIPSQ